MNDKVATLFAEIENRIFNNLKNILSENSSEEDIQKWVINKNKIGWFKKIEDIKCLFIVESFFDVFDITKGMRKRLGDFGIFVTIGNRYARKLPVPHTEQYATVMCIDITRSIQYSEFFNLKFRIDDERMK